MKVDSNQQGICLSNFANQAAENGVLQVPFRSLRYQAHFSFQYNIHTTLSILILIDYLPAEVYTEISPLSSLSLPHLFILSMSIINTVTLLVAAVTLFQCSCCQVNFLEGLIVTFTKILWEIRKVFIWPAVFNFTFSGNWPVLSLDVLFENKIQRETHCVLARGYVG